MKKFNHVGIPTKIEREGENFAEDLGVYLTDFENSECKIEWLRFVDGSPMPQEIQNVAHIAYEVEDLEEAIKGEKVIMQPTNVNGSLKIAFIVVEDEAPIELMQFL